MFLEKTTKKIKGYIEIKVYGYFVERFFNLALKENIKLWDIKKVDNVSAIACANIYDYKRLNKIAQIANCKLNISKKVGMPFFILKHKKRKIFAICFILIAICIYVYGLHIWNVDIIGDFTFPIEDIKKELEMENVKVGVLKNSLDVSRIKNNIYMRRHDIAWIGISFKGTRATVEVVQGNLKKIEDELDKVPCNIVANKEGMVYKINILEGEGLVNSGDMIKSGDILISGVMSSDGTPTRYVNAKGEIFIKTWYTNKVNIPLERDIISQTGREAKSYILQIENYKINLGNNGTKFEKYDTIISDKKLNLFGKLSLPIGLKEITYKEIDVDTVKYTEKQAVDSTKQKVINDVLKKVENLNMINKTDVKTIMSGDNITVIVTIECIEKVGIKKKLEGY